MTAKRPSSKRVAWPEPGHHDGGEFRLTWGRLAAIVGTLIGMMGAVPIYWTIGDHWMNRVEIEKKMKDHSDHDAAREAWTTYNFSANRLDYLDDKQFECDAKKLVNPKLKSDDLAICAHYETKQKAKQIEAADLKAKASETTKEK